MSIHAKMFCDGCEKWKVTFLTKVCGACTYKAEQERKARCNAAARAREAAQDRRGTVGDPGATEANVAAFDAFSADVRERAGCSRRVG